MYVSLCYAKKVGTAIRASDLPFRIDGPVKNVYVFASVADLFAMGNTLFSQGVLLYPLVDYAKKYGVTRQAVNNWIWRDGKRVCLTVEKSGRNLSFIVDTE